MKILNKKLEEAKKAKEQAKQERYEVGVAEIEEAPRVEVAEVCRFYCLQVWNEVLDQTEVEASSALKRVENVYYPPKPYATLAPRAPRPTWSLRG